MILAAIERGGNVRMQLAKSKRASRKELHTFIRANVSMNAENIYTDEARGYRGIGSDTTKHDTVTHSRKEYVRGNVHTNTVESVFSLFKRSLVGSFHQISEKHVDRYLDEFEFRFNNRKNPYMFRDTLLRLIDAKSMPYEKLTA